MEENQTDALSVMKNHSYAIIPPLIPKNFDLSGFWGFGVLGFRV